MAHFAHRVWTPRVGASENWFVGALPEILAVAPFAGRRDAHVKIIFAVIACPCHVGVTFDAFVPYLERCFTVIEVASVALAIAACVACTDLLAYLDLLSACIAVGTLHVTVLL